MNAEEILPRELTSPVPRRGKWTPEEERYTEKIICKWLSYNEMFLWGLLGEHEILDLYEIESTDVADLSLYLTKVSLLSAPYTLQSILNTELWMSRREQRSVRYYRRS